MDYQTVVILVKIRLRKIYNGRPLNDGRKLSICIAITIEGKSFTIDKGYS